MNWATGPAGLEPATPGLRQLPDRTVTAWKAVARGRSQGARHYARQSSLLAGVAASFAAPTLPPFPEGDSGDDEGRSRVGPPPAEQGVREQPDK
jgi:hypothetical protein